RLRPPPRRRAVAAARARSSSRHPTIGPADGPHRRFGAPAPRPYGGAVLAFERYPTTLLVVDLQQGFDAPLWGRRNNPHLEQRVSDLLHVWRGTGRPVVHVRHMSTDPSSALRPGQPGNAFKPATAPVAGEVVIEKRVNSA